MGGYPKCLGGVSLISSRTRRQMPIAEFIDSSDDEKVCSGTFVHNL